MMSKDIFEKLSQPSISVPSSGTGLFIGGLSGNDILIALSILLVLVQIFVHTPRMISAARYWLDVWKGRQ